MKNIQQNEFTEELLDNVKKLHLSLEKYKDVAFNLSRKINATSKLWNNIIERLEIADATLDETIEHLEYIETMLQ